MNWKEILDAADDDYLVGISNKGILKRAYKDQEESGESISVDFSENTETLRMMVGGEQVTLSYPLADSKCTCPSRSICRHVMLGILLAKRQVGDLREETAESKEQETEIAPIQQENNESLVQAELKAYPLKPLLKALGMKGLRTLIGRMQTNEKPQIQYASVVTVKLPEQEMVVKLLSPLEYSACTCHKKELCAHKAEAILWYQWLEQVITLEQLMEENRQESEYDREQIGVAAGQLKAYLEELFGMGLCRTSMDVINTLERLAILAHNAKLPRQESRLRALSDSYGKYLRRSTGFSPQNALGQISRLYQDATSLLQVQEDSQVNELAGEFRAEYKPIGDLDLVGITWEHFVSQSGYEGETVYFLEEKKKQVYTYTNARPTFYDGKKRSGYNGKAQSPWGLNVPIEGMANLKIHLHLAKADESGKLSSSQETRGEILGSRYLEQELLAGRYYEDFGLMFREQIKKEQRGECLVFVKPAHVGKACFDEVGQVLYMPMWDENGRKITIEVPYSQKEDATIRYLERFKDGRNTCFLGRLYLKGSKLYLYPLDLYTKRQIPWLEEKETIEQTEKEETSEEIYECIAEKLRETQNILQDLFQVGITIVQDSMLERIQELAEWTKECGMSYLSEQIHKLFIELESQKHRINKEETFSGIIEIYMGLCEYVRTGNKKVMLDQAENYYEED